MFKELSKKTAASIVALVAVFTLGVFALAGCSGSAAAAVTVNSSPDNTLTATLSNAKKGETSFGELRFADNEAAQIEYDLSSGSAKIEIVQTSYYGNYSMWTSEELTGSGTVQSDKVSAGTYRIRITSAADGTSGKFNVVAGEYDMPLAESITGSTTYDADGSNPWTIEVANPDLVENVTNDVPDSQTTSYTLSPKLEGETTVTLNRAATDSEKAVKAVYTIEVAYGTPKAETAATTGAEGTESTESADSAEPEKVLMLRVKSYEGPDEYKWLFS